MLSAKFEIMDGIAEKILFIMRIVRLGSLALFANEVHKFTHTHTINSPIEENEKSSSLNNDQQLQEK